MGGGDGMDLYCWLFATSVLLVVWITTLRFTVACFAAGAFMAFIIGAVGAPLWVQAALFLWVSVFLSAFSKLAMKKHLNTSRAKTNIDSLIGKHVRVCEDIDNLNQIGKVMLDGMEWTARGIGSDWRILAGTKVVVREVKGAHVVVAPCRE